MIRVAATAPLSVPGQSVDLAHWVRQLTDEQYRRASSAHWAWGTHSRPDGTTGTVSVESMGGVLVVNHYVEQESRPDYTRYASQSRALIGRFLPYPVRVTWEMSVHEDQPAFLQCQITLEFATPVLQALTHAILLRRTIARHCHDEIRGYATDIDRKHARGVSDQGHK